MAKKYLILSAILLVAVLALVSVSNAFAAEPCFNCMPNDLETLRLKNRTQGSATWQDPISANPGDTIGFDIYYHNSSIGTTAKNTRVKIEFPTDLRTQIVTTGHIGCDNCSTKSDTGTINLSSLQCLNFSTKVLWYPNQSTQGQEVSATLSSGNIEVNIGDITCVNAAQCWDNQGHLVFEATVSNLSPSLTISTLSRNLTQGQTSYQDSISVSPSDIIEIRIEINSNGSAPANNVFVKATLASNISYQDTLTIDGVNSTADIINGFNLGAISIGQSRVLIYRVQIASESQFGYGTTNLVVNTQTSGDNVSQISDPTSINVYRPQPSQPSQPPATIYYPVSYYPAPLTISPANIAISSLVKNLTQNSDWQTFVETKPNDLISFSIKVSSISNLGIASNVYLKVIIPNGLIYQPNSLTIEGVSSTADIVQAINLGDFYASQSKVINFKVKVGPENQFSYGATDLIVTASAYNSYNNVNATNKISIIRKAVLGAATEIKTGLTNNKILDWIIIPLLMTIGFIWVFSSQLIDLNGWLEKKKKIAFESKIERLLKRKISKLKI